ncbi:MAG: hypothetical protein JSV93_04190 [Candidatus Omnitrophota bacterium]|nr:MAG: hypothetical protein JSV93_04190 [Candidatus Omnitrophota bacterium]
MTGWRLWRLAMTCVISILVVFPACWQAGVSEAAVVDTYYDDFDDRQADATIDGVDHWSVDKGNTNYAVTQETTTLTGTGNAIELTGDETSVNVSRTKVIGDLSPCWVEYYVRPGVGNQTQDIPAGKAAAVTFDHTGKILAADGSSWMDTEKTFTADSWYRVLLKLDFSKHLYDIYIFPASVPREKFIPAKENLRFIDTSINSLGGLGFEGVYNATQDESDDSYIDNLLVNFVRRLEIITSVRALTKGEISQPIIVQLQNEVSAPQTAWEDITLELRSESENGEFSLDKDDWQPIEQIIIPEGNFQGEFYYKDTEVGSPIISVKEYPDRGWETGLQKQKIVSELTYFDVSLMTPQIAGEYFEMKITAKDEDGEASKGYDGTIELRAKYVSPETGTMNIITPSPFPLPFGERARPAPRNDMGVRGFKEGVLELEAMYPDCGYIEIEVIDIEDPDKTGISGETLFIPASFGVTPLEEVQIVSKPFTLEVTSFNAQKDVTPNYEGPCELTGLHILPEHVLKAVMSPNQLDEKDFDGGRAELEVTYNRWGELKIKAQDSAHPSRMGLSEIVKFHPESIKVEVKPPPGERIFFYTGEEIEITVSLLDEAGEPVVNYLGSIAIDASPELALLPAYQFTESDEGTHAFVVACDSSDEYFVTVEEKSAGISAESPPIKVKQATIVVIPKESPTGTAEVTIIITDEEGNIITSESDMLVWVSLEEEFPNDSALSTAILRPVIFHNGVSRIIITDPEAEVVTVTPRSEYEFKIKQGTVTFGRIAKKGIGTLLWRELKE